MHFIPLCENTIDLQIIGWQLRRGVFGGLWMTATLELAEYLRSTHSLPANAGQSTRRAILDLVTAAVGGFSTRSGASARAAAKAVWGPGPATVWFSAVRLAPAGAAFANAAIASALDLDDGHRAAAGHPGAAVIPAVLATAEAVGSRSEQILTAIALGYEVGVRISAARGIVSLPTTDSGLWAGQAVAAAAGWLRDLDVPRLAHAIAIAGTTAPSQSATPYTRFMGNNVKEGIPTATANGLTAVELAARDFTGPLDIFDNDKLYNRSVLTGDLGRRWQIEGVYFKPYSSCRWIHAPTDAILAIRQQHSIPAAAIQAIEIATFSRALTLNNDVAPKTIEAAQYSIPFCVALAAVHGSASMLPITEASLVDPDVLALAQRVHLTVDPELDTMFSDAVPARIVVKTEHGCLVHTVLIPRGEPSNPMTDADLKAKFYTVARGRIEPVFAQALLDGVDALRRGDIAPLVTALGAQVRPSQLDRAQLKSFVDSVPST